MKRWGAILLITTLLMLVARPANADRVTAHNHLVVVQTTAVTALAKNVLRRLLGLINDGSNVVYCRVDGTTATVNSGIRLAAAGTTGDRIIFDNNVPLDLISCIAASGSTILVIEGR